MNPRFALWTFVVLSLLRMHVFAQEQPPEQKSQDAQTGAEARISIPAQQIALESFGYSVFNLMPAQVDTMFGSMDSGYPIGPGDEIAIAIWGAVEKNHSLKVDRNGGITIPQVGWLPVSGVLLGDLEKKVKRFLGSAYSTIRMDPAQTSTTFVDVSLGKLRMIQVYVVGEVQKPGTYLVHSTSTVLNALYQAGGPTEGGSLRNIRLARHDKTVGVLDFYKFILRGDKSEDVRLQSKDVIQVPPLAKEVRLQGQVHRPALYELKAEEGLKRLIEIAGGLQPDAYAERVQIKRIVEYRTRQVIDVDLVDLLSSAEEYPLEDGDQITVFKIPDTYENAVSIEGYTKRPGIYQLLPGMTVKDLTLKSAGIFPEAYLGRANLVRKHPDLTRELFPFHLGKALKGDPTHNLELKPLDKITIYSIHTFGDEKLVTIDGLVRHPGRYDLLEGMNLQDLIVLAGGLQDAAHKLEAEIARSDPNVATSERPIQLFEARISDRYEVDSSQPDELLLQNLDEVFIRHNPDFELQQYVEIKGQVHFPGRYALKSRSDHLNELVQRAGNLKEEAYLEGIRFSRDTSNIAVNLKAALKNPGGADDLILRDGDVIDIPQRPSTVQVSGAVYESGSVLFRSGKGVEYYLERSGGLRKNGDKGRTYVILANGEALKPGRFLLWRQWPRVVPGSQIVVPAKPVDNSQVVPAKP